MRFIKSIIRRVLYGFRCDSETYINYLKKHGATIGENVTLFASNKTNIDVLNPHLISIGNNVNIVASTILTHDYSWSVIKGITGKILGNQRAVTIGNNVFIGQDSIVLGGSKIGNNVIVGAHSVVSGTLCDNGVYAGSPARYIMSIGDYFEKREKNQYNEAKDFCLKYKEAHGQFPPEEKLHEYFFIFSSNTDNLIPAFDDKLKLCGNYEQSVKVIQNNKPMFDSYISFLHSIDPKEKRTHEKNNAGIWYSPGSNKNVPSGQ